MRMVYLAIAIVLPSTIFAQDFKRFQDSVILIASSCKAIITDMSSGELKVTDGDSFTSICELGKNLNIKCSYVDSKNKVYATREMVGGISGSEGGILSDSDKFLMNGITRKFMSEANIVISDNRIRGKKICSGEWIYQKEMNEIIKK